MRTLKYRAYIKPLKRYAEKYETILCHHQCNMEPSWTVNISPEEYYGDEDLVIEQFTGLLDRNGQKIYEGDILDDGTHICKIKWSEHFAAFEALNEHEGYKSNAWFEAKYGEVIGNIHETPGLLVEINDVN